MEIAVMHGISRNASGRPTVLHDFRYGQTRTTACGTPTDGWSVMWVPQTLALGALSKLRCGSCLRRKS